MEGWSLSTALGRIYTKEEGRCRSIALEGPSLYYIGVNYYNTVVIGALVLQEIHYARSL